MDTRNERMPTGIVGLDAMLRGGFLPRTANLVEGAPGCGKSTLGMHFLHAGALSGQPGLLISFEEFPEHYHRDAASFGWDFPELERRGLLKVMMSSPEVIKADLEGLGGSIEHIIADLGIQRVVLDSITHFEHLAEDTITVRGFVYGLINALKRQEVTTLITRETPYLIGHGEEASLESGIHFIVDSYLMLRYVEIDSTIRRALIVLKMRGSEHDHQIRQYEIGPHGVEVLTPFIGQEAIMSGTPTRMAESFIKAFVKR